MCGIAGMVGFSDKNLLKKMCDIISHRGPDEEGYFVDTNVCLGNRRLSIIDVSGGKMPISNENESIWITFNGEIYNFKELMKVLKNKGHRFKTRSDTEVILHLYEEFGFNCVKYLRGIFAFAIWDGNKKLLFLARDRLGVKPLYYTTIGNQLIFSSEIKSIFLDERVERKVNLNALYYFLVLRYTPSYTTMFKNIFRLPPGNTLVWKNGDVKINRYWKVNMNPKYDSENYYIKKTKKMLNECVRTELVSEVPLGAFLSGGIDSSSVVALMTENMNESVKTFSVGFEDERANELNYARVVADYLGTDHREFVIETEDYKLLPEIIWHFDEPLATDISSIPLYQLSKLAKKYVTVVLTGDGGDEVFGGYEIFKIMKYSEKFLNFIPSYIRKIGFNIGFSITPKKIQDAFFGFASSLGKKGNERCEKYFTMVGKNTEKSYLEIVGIFDEEETNDLCTNKIPKKNISESLSKYFIDKSKIFNNLILLETEIKLPDNYLLKTDKMTMAFGIEARVPLLDYKLVELAAKFPENLKLRFLKDKYILRKIMETKLPKNIITRKKQRWFVPIDNWFESDLMDIFKELYSEKNVKKLDYFKYEYIKKMISDFKKSKLYYARQMWSLLVFELWRRIFIENDFRKKPKLFDKILY